MSRASDRLFGAMRGRLKRLGTSVKAALTDDSYRSDDAKHKDAADKVEAAEVLRTAGRLRGGAAKIAQLRAYLELEDGLGPDARLQLSQLWDRVPSDPPAVIRQVVAEQLGAPVSERFATWEEEPLAAASLGQVHGATLADGTELAVKVQYPGIAEALSEDLKSPSLVRSLVGPGLAEGAERGAVDTLREAIAREVDYHAELVSLQRFGRAFFNDPQIVLPRPIPDRSSARVLTMTRLRGRPLAEIAQSGSPGEREAVARTLFRFAFGAPLRHGLINGDPHPGNYLVLDAAAGKVGFLDFGFVVEMDEALQAIDRRMFLSLVHRDGEALRYAAYELGLVPKVGVFDHGNWRELEHALSAPFVKRGARRFGPAESGTLAKLLRELMRAGAMRIPAAAVILWRQRMGALSVIGSLGATLDLRRVLCELLDDGHHPTPLYERYP